MARRLYLTQDAASWEAAGGWPTDPLWTESNWPVTTPYVSHSVRRMATCPSKPCPDSPCVYVDRMAQITLLRAD
jgi:hypothetical protein